MTSFQNKTEGWDSVWMVERMLVNLYKMVREGLMSVSI